MPLRVEGGVEGMGLEAYHSLAALPLLPAEQATHGTEGKAFTTAWKEGLDNQQRISAVMTNCSQFL